MSAQYQDIFARRNEWKRSLAMPTGWEGEIDHQQPADSANGHRMPLTGTATVPEDLPHVPRVLLVRGS